MPDSSTIPDDKRPSEEHIFEREGGIRLSRGCPYLGRRRVVTSFRLYNLSDPYSNYGQRVFPGYEEFYAK